MPRTDYDAKLNDYINPLGATYEGKGDKKVSKEFFEILMFPLNYQLLIDFD